MFVLQNHYLAVTEHACPHFCRLEFIKNQPVVDKGFFNVFVDTQVGVWVQLYFDTYSYICMCICVRMCADIYFLTVS